MKISTKIWLPALCLVFLALTFARPTGRSPITIQFAGATNPAGWSGTPPLSMLVFIVTNASSTPMEVSVHPKYRGTPDWPRGTSGRLPPHSGRAFQADILGQRSPWTVSIKNHRIPGKLEQWLRTYGSKLRLCDITPNSEIKLVKISTNATGLFQVEAQ